MSTSTPILLFAYNRPHHLQRTLDSLSGCRRLGECRLVIYSDAPKYAQHAEAVTAVRKVIADWQARHTARLAIDVIEREANVGLARSVVGGVSEHCARAGRVIVLEDDLVVSPDFLDYMLTALAVYADAPQVYQIAGYVYPYAPPPAPDYFLMPLTTTWGWATWARAWQAFAWSPPDIDDFLADPVAQTRFDLNNTYPYTEMLRNRLAGLNDSWGILWWYAVFRAGGLVLYPRHTLVRNDGFDGSGTHYTTADARMTVPEHAWQPLPSVWQPLSSLTHLPASHAVDWEMFVRTRNALRSFGSAPTPQPHARLGRVRATLERLFQAVRP